MMTRLNESRVTLRNAKRELERAKRVTVSADAECDRLSLVLERTRVLGNAFVSAEPEEKKLLLDAWIDGILVVVEPVPDMPRANFKTAIVDLSSAPGLPKYFELQTGQGTLRASAATSSERTRPSSSKGKRARSAARAPAVPMDPSAHATCDRTSGSSSASAALKTSTSSEDPTLPKTTAALRTSPARLARFIGEPRNADAYSSRDNPSNQRDSCNESTPSMCGFAANAGSVDGFENVWFQGHTSWEMCRLTYFVISLSTGRLTLKKTKG